MNVDPRHIAAVLAGCERHWATDPTPIAIGQPFFRTDPLTRNGRISVAFKRNLEAALRSATFR